MLKLSPSLVRNGAILTLLLFAGWYIPTRGRTSRLAIEDAHNLPASPAAKDIWLTSDRDLISLTEGTDRLRIARWKVPGTYDKPIESVEIPLAELTAPLLEGNSQRTRSEHPALEFSSIAYNVFSEADRVTWAFDGYLYFADYPFQPGTVKRLSTRTKHEVTDLTFAKKDLIIILYDDGKVETLDIQEGKSGLAGTWVQEGWSFWTRGESDLLALASFSSAEVAWWLHPAANKIDLGFLRLPSDRGTALAVARTGEKMAVGMEDGNVLFFPDCRKGENLSIPLEHARPIRALAFFSDKEIIAAGDFPGIFLLQPNREPIKIGSSPSGVTDLAFQDGFIAYLTPSGTTVGEIRENRKLNDMGRFVVSICIGLISLAIALSNLLTQKDRGSAPSPVKEGQEES